MIENLESTSPEANFATAEKAFVENDYPMAEPILHKLMMQNSQKPEVYHMLGTIYYDQGKFKKAIRCFERALELDPGFTDSSVGLSIILNDLGRYEEGQRVFNEAKLMLAEKTKTPDEHLNEKFAAKHSELGELYYRHSRFTEALQQFQMALTLTSRKLDVRLQLVDCLVELDRPLEAIRNLHEILREQPNYTPALLRLGKAHYDLRQIPEAIDCWEKVLEQEPSNKTASNYLRLVQTVQVTTVNEPQIEL